MKPTNRLHCTRWPRDPKAALDLAAVDTEFALVMGRLMGVTPELLRIEAAANRVGLAAKTELRTRGL